MIPDAFIEACKKKAQDKADKENKIIYLLEEIDCVYYASDEDEDWFNPKDIIFTATPKNS